jgi:outer membrane cobalamin receptor
LKFTAGYHFEGDRWSYFNGEEVEMGVINDLNVGAVYTINDSFSLNVKANNLLFQHYDIWYGYPAQGFNASGGFTFSF